MPQEADLTTVALVTSLWCLFHSLFVTHAWDRFVDRRFERHAALQRIVYVVFSTVSFAALAWWLRSLPERVLWDWPGQWSIVRWLGVAVAVWLFWLGARAFDGKRFFGLRQWRDWRAHRTTAPEEFHTNGVLDMMRHPWYAGTLILLVYCLPFTDVNLVWRGVFVLYTLMGAELEERKLLAEIGEPYREYRRRVPRFFPRLRRKSPG